MQFSKYFSKNSKNGLSKSFKDSLDGVRMINMKELFGHNPITDSVNMRKIELTENEFRRFSIKYNDLLFGRRSLVYDGSGKTTIYKGSLPTIFESSIIRVRLNKNKCDPDFANSYFNSPLGRGKVLSIVTGAAVFGIRGSDLAKLKVNFPPLPTQQKIAATLSAYDDLIDNNAQRIRLLEEMAEEIYKEWFVRLRFPGYEHATFVDKKGNKVSRDTDGALPEGWVNVKVSETGDVITGKTPSKKNKDNFGSEIPFVKTPDMAQGIFFIKTDEALSLKGANSQKNQFVPKNSICVSCIGTVGKVGITTDISQTNQQINTLIPKRKEFLEHLYFSLLRLKPVIESYATTGATMANLSKSKFKNLKLQYPTIKVLREYNKLVNPLFEEIKILLQKNQVLQETRDLLLPRLISGKLDLNDLSPETEKQMNLAAEPGPKYQNP